MRPYAKALLLAAIATVWPVVAVDAQTTAPADLDPAHIVADEVASLSRDMVEPGPNQDVRDAAAHRLLDIGTNEARSAVQAALHDPGNNPGRLAAVRAVADDVPGDQEFVDALFVLLDADVPKQIVDSAVVALGNFKLEADVSRRLVDLSKPGHPEAQRLAAIRAMAGQVEKRVAEQLVALTQEQSPTIAPTAFESLRQFTSLALASPTDWWKTQAAVPEDRFRLDMLNARAMRSEGEVRRGEDTFQELKRSVLKDISAAPRDQRADVIIKYLTSPRSAVRLIAVAQAYEYARTGDLPAPARPAVRELLSDGDPDVRLMAARTIAATGDPDAFAAVARQTAVESDPRVRADLATMLAPIGKTDAVPLLRYLLDDPSNAVVVAASMSLAQVGGDLAQRSPTEAADLAITLQAALQARSTGGAATAEVREALVKALVPLGQQSMLSSFKAMLTKNPPEPESIRKLAVAGLGAIGKQDMADLLVEALRDDSKDVRIQAAQSLGALGSINKTFENAEAIYRAMDPSREKEPEVIKAEWASICTLMPFAPTNQLARWPDLPYIRDNDPRLLDVYTVLEQKAVAAADWNYQAHCAQELGDTLMRMGDVADSSKNLPVARQRYAEATVQYQNGLTVTRAHGLSAMIVQTMIVNTVKSQLRSGDYAGAAKFASDQFGGPGGDELQGTIGPEFKLEAERLASENKLDDAKNLIREALAMSPALANQSRSHLLEVQQTVDKRQREHNEFAIPDYLRSLAMR